ncbi:MAG: RDD family protein [Oligoflexia bacterium]|nr:RDD family protein [Oligoflexia bacterium]
MKHNFEQFTRRAFDQWKIANPWLRLGAQLIDQGLIGFATGSILTFLFPEKAWTTLWWITWLLFWPFVSLSTQCLFLSIMHTTPGKKAFGLRIQSAKPNHPLSPWQILERTTAWWLGFFTIGASWSTILSRSDRRAWHDIVAETVVVHDEVFPNYISPIERKVGRAWAITVSFLLISALSVSLLINIKKLSNSVTEKSTALSPSNRKQIESFSWLMLIGELPQIVDQGMPKNDEKLLSAMTHFSKARTLPSVDRYAYYKENIQVTEDWLCRPGQTASQECQSVQLMAALLSEKSLDAQTPGALLVLKVISNLEKLDSVNDELEYLVKESKTALLNSAQYLAMKTKQALLNQKKGDFKKAYEVLAQDVEFLEQDNMGASEKILFDTLVNTACESQALTDCTQVISQCTRLPFWSEWSAGCRAKEKPDTNTAQSLGYWWKVANSDVMVPLADWEKSKTAIENVNQTEFEKNIIQALDLAIAVKSQDPQNLVARSQNLSVHNPLWGWAQKQAIGKFGKQWSLLLKKPEQMQLAHFKLMPKNANAKRAIASEKSLVKKKKKKKK